MKILKNHLRGYSVKVQGSKIVGQLERTRMFKVYSIAANEVPFQKPKTTHRVWLADILFFVYMNLQGSLFGIRIMYSILCIFF